MNKDRPIIALDFSNANDVHHFLSHFKTTQLNIKIGMELFYATGAPLVKDLVSKGYSVFLDLKLHDIPNTVEHAVKVISQLGCQMINVHASGGFKMMKSAVDAVKKTTNRPLLIAVTQLTSTDDIQVKEEQLCSVSLNDSVIHLAKLAKQAGMDGVVCSPHEVAIIKKCCGKKFLTVTPGIRLKESPVDDQVRITTVKQAKEIGSDFIVVGRPITRASDVKQAYQNILVDWSDSYE